MTSSANDRVSERFGRNVRDLRLRRGLTQDQLATTIGLSRASIANIEQGRQQVLLDHAWSIARALGAASIDELIGASEPAEPRKLSLSVADQGYAEWALAVVGGKG